MYNMQYVSPVPKTFNYLVTSIPDDKNFCGAASAVVGSSRTRGQSAHALRAVRLALNGATKL